MHILTIFLALVVVLSFAFVNAYAESYMLTVRADPNIIFITGGGLYEEGEEVVLDTAPQSWNDYQFVGWKVDGRWAFEDPLVIRMDRAHSVVAVYEKTQEVGGIVVDIIPRISEITVDGTIYLPSELPLTFSWESGSEHTISIPNVVNIDPQTRYMFDSWKDQNKDVLRTIVVDEDTQFIALYKTQHYLKPITEYGSVKGGGWQDEGSTANFELVSDVIVDRKDQNVRYVFDSWNLGDYHGSVSNTIDIEEPTTVKANWNKQFRLELKSNIPDYDLFGTGWYDEGRQVALIAEEELESPNSDIKYVFEKWVSKGPNPVIIPNAQSPSTTITMEEPYIIEAHYKKSFQVNVWTPYGNAIGAGFYKDGDVAEISLHQTEVVVSPMKVRKIFDGWNTNGARTMDFSEGAADEDLTRAAGQNLIVFVDNPINITADWRTQYYLDVQSALPQAKVKGAGWYDVGRLVPISADIASVPPGMWSTNTFDRWTGDVEGDSVNERVMMNGPKNVIAEWKEDNTPGIVNGVILASVAGIAGLIYTKTRKSHLLEHNHKGGIGQIKEKSFEKFFSLRQNKSPENVPNFYNKPKGSSKIMDWLLGRDK